MADRGDKVEVRTRFSGAWTKGFEVVERTDAERYRIRRTADGSVLPVDFDQTDVRPDYPTVK